MPEHLSFFFSLCTGMIFIVFLFTTHLKERFGRLLPLTHRLSENNKSIVKKGDVLLDIFRNREFSYTQLLNERYNDILNVLFIFFSSIHSHRQALPQFSVVHTIPLQFTVFVAYLYKTSITFHKI